MPERHVSWGGRFCLLGAGLLAAPLFAQTASQITPPSFAPPAQRPSVAATIPNSARSNAPAGSDTIEVRLAGVAVEGIVIDPAVQADLTARLVGHKVKVSELFAAAHALEVHYARAGHVLTRVVIPPQDLAEGATVRLVVVQGFIERVDVTHVPPRVAGKVAAYLHALVGDRSVTERDIERKLLLAADLPGVRLRSTLAAGSAPGASVLVIEATQAPVTGFVTIDNTLPGALGRDAFGVGLDFNSLLGAGETLYARISGLPSTGNAGLLQSAPRNRALAAGAILLIGSNGLTFTLEGTDARTAPRHLAGLPGFGSRFRRLSGRIRYPLIRSRALTFSAQASFDAQDERVRIVDPVILPLSLDSLRIARLAGDLNAALPRGGVVSVRVQASFGVDALGARSAADATALLPLSRAGTDADFQKIELSASLDQPLARHLAVALRGRAQTAFGEVMANSEQIGTASLDAISPLPSGTLQGDAGYVVRGELRAPFAFAMGFASIAPYAFGVHGLTRFENPTVAERRSTGASAFGGGVRLAGSAADGRPGVSAAIEYGRAHVAGLAGHPDRVSFTFVAQF